MEWMEWRLKREEESLVPLFDWFPLFNLLVMNVIVWNCRGTLKTNFQRHVNELVRIHNPVILVVMETRVGGDKVKEIIDRLPFDDAILAETIGYAGGIWLLWNSNRVAVMQLASTEQEIHVEVKVLPLTFLRFYLLCMLVLELWKGKCYGKTLLKLLSCIVNLG